MTHTRVICLGFHSVILTFQSNGSQTKFQGLPPWFDVRRVALPGFFTLDLFLFHRPVCLFYYYLFSLTSVNLGFFNAQLIQYALSLLSCMLKYIVKADHFCVHQNVRYVYQHIDIFFAQCIICLQAVVVLEPFCRAILSMLNL